MARAASSTWFSSARLPKNETVNPIVKTRHSAAAETSRTRRNMLVLVLLPLAPRAHPGLRQRRAGGRRGKARPEDARGASGGLERRPLRGWPGSLDGRVVH